MRVAHALILNACTMAPMHDMLSACSAMRWYCRVFYFCCFEFPALLHLCKRMASIEDSLIACLKAVGRLREASFYVNVAKVRACLFTCIRAFENSSSLTVHAKVLIHNGFEQFADIDGASMGDIVAPSEVTINSAQRTFIVPAMEYHARQAWRRARPV